MTYILVPTLFRCWEFNKIIMQLDIRTLITWLNVWVANECETPKIYLTTLKEQPCAILYMVNAKCRCGTIGLGTITVIGSFIILCSILHKMKLNVSLSIRRVSLNSSFSKSRIHHSKAFFALLGLDLEFSVFSWTVLNSL